METSEYTTIMIEAVQFNWWLYGAIIAAGVIVAIFVSWLGAKTDNADLGFRFGLFIAAVVILGAAITPSAVVNKIVTDRQDASLQDQAGLRCLEWSTSLFQPRDYFTACSSDGQYVKASLVEIKTDTYVIVPR